MSPARTKRSVGRALGISAVGDEHPGHVNPLGSPWPRATDDVVDRLTAVKARRQVEVGRRAERKKVKMFDGHLDLHSSLLFPHANLDPGPVVG